MYVFVLDHVGKSVGTQQIEVALDGGLLVNLDLDVRLDAQRAGHVVLVGRALRFLGGVETTIDELLQELVDRGFYSAEEAQRATNKNYVTRALGVEPNVEVEIHEEPAVKGDFYLLCSDGLSDMVEDEDIHLTINTFSASLDTVAKQLIQLTNDNGGRDNVSVLITNVVDSFPARKRVIDKVLGWFS